MRASRDDGWQVEFACADGPFAARLRDEGFHHRRSPMTRAASPWRQAIATLGFARAIRADAPDLIHTHAPAGGLVGRAGAALTGFRGPVIHTFHGLPFETRPRGLVERTYLIAERILADRTTFFFSQSRGDADRAVEMGFARRDSLMVIGNGVDVRRFAPDPLERERVRSELGVRADAVIVMSVARLVREKGLLELADAALELKGDERLNIMIIGESLPSDRTAIDAELRAHPVNAALGDRWKMLGHRADVDRLLKAADIFTLPSFREGLPRSVIEAMASAVPVLVSDIPACRELVREGETGAFVPVGDSKRLAATIAAFAGDPGARQRLGLRGREVAIANHDERLVLDRQLTVFRGLTGR